MLKFICSQIQKAQKTKANPSGNSFFLLSLGAFSLLVAAAPTLAVERVNVRIGSIEQSVMVEDLERFAETGEISSSLKPFAFILTPDVRRVFGERLSLEPEKLDQQLNDLLKSSEGERIRKAVELAFPGTSIEQIQVAIILAAQQADGISITRILRAIPGESLDVNLTGLITAVSQIKLPRLGDTSSNSFPHPQQQLVGLK